MTRTVFFVVALFLMICTQKEVQGQRKPVDKKANQTLRVLTYNIHHANPPSKPGLIDLDAIARVIIDSKADVVALQEVENGANRTGKTDQAKLLGEKTGLHYQFFKAIDFDGGEYGIAVLSRYKLSDIKLVPLPQQVTDEKRVLGYATIKVGKQDIILANTHLDARRTDENRVVQMERILKEFENTALPVILCGDLNAVAGTEVINLLDGQFKRTCTENCGFTIPEVTPTHTIDFIAGKNLKWPVLEHKVIDEPYASDHRPVIAVFKTGK
ncbi:endonuclease/exonuclease/phosphatase family protein [Pedobacter nyackensis]|uniref:endonuclease/exonuclease/phosphatase family protein n=1 Tax=Pedobacter nyackensis TaxID=475255 RepID=UPI00292CC547|nr:endonuclease/exonuclease/phosphatase family protein [Pedobacter nyackensis]